MIKQARERFGDKIKIYKKDIMEDKLANRFNLVLMSGLLNRNVGQDVKWVKAFIKRMFALSREAISFNAISTHVKFNDGEMFYIDPEDILRFCIDHLSPRVSLFHHNLPYNYTITVFKDKDWSSI